MDGDSRSPSFKSYSNGRVADIADRVAKEFDCDAEADLECLKRGEEEEFEFQFAIAAGDAEFTAPITPDEVCIDDKIRPVYPVFGRDFYLGSERLSGGNEGEIGSANSDPEKARAIRLPLRKWFDDERETRTVSSCSSSEADELDGVPADTYCVWRPMESAEARCKKSNSSGSQSKRWMLRVKELLHRSHSDARKESILIIDIHSRKEDSEKTSQHGGGRRFHWKMKQALGPPPGVGG